MSRFVAKFSLEKTALARRSAGLSRGSLYRCRPVDAVVTVGAGVARGHSMRPLGFGIVGCGAAAEHLSSSACLMEPLSGTHPAKAGLSGVASRLWRFKPDRFPSRARRSWSAAQCLEHRVRLFDISARSFFGECR